MSFSNPSFRVRAIIGFIIVLVLIAAAIPAVIIAHQAGLRHAQRVNTPDRAPSPPPQPRTYTVGILISEYSASGPTWMNKPYGVRDTFVVDALRDSSIRRIPLVEPGTEKIPEIAEVIHKNFRDASPLNVDDPAALKSLDVIVTANAVNVHDTTLASIQSAVESGVGLLRWANLGDITPGFADPTVLKLAGMTRAAYCETNSLTGCTVLLPHPILGNLAKNQTVRLQASGVLGELVPGAIPLIEIANQSEAHTYSPGIPFDRGDLRCYPAYTATLGKGKIVSFPTPAFRELPYKFTNAIGEKFTVKCARWLAEKSTTQPTR